MAVDPICGMSVDEKKFIRLHIGGEEYFFCSAHCKDKFSKSRTPSPVIAKKSHGAVIYTCLMHPEVEQDHPGDCPKCGMALEPKNASLEDNSEQKEIKALSRKFWVGLFLGPLKKCF